MIIHRILKIDKRHKKIYELENFSITVILKLKNYLSIIYTGKSVNFLERPDSKQFRLLSHMVCVVTTQLCCYSVKAATDNKTINEYSHSNKNSWALKYEFHRVFICHNLFRFFFLLLPFENVKTTLARQVAQKQIQASFGLQAIVCTPVIYTNIMSIYLQTRKTEFFSSLVSSDSN